MESDYGLKTYCQCFTWAEDTGADWRTAVNRLDRLTSGLMLLATSGKAASKLGLEFAEGKVKKEYVARVMGKFPESVDPSIIVKAPLTLEGRKSP